MKKKHLSARIIAVLAVIALGCANFTGCSSKDDVQENSDQQESLETEAQNPAPDSEPDQDSKSPEKLTQKTTEPETEPVTEHVSPIESITTQLGTQQAFSGVKLNHETNKNYPIQLSGFIEPGDSVQSFIFEFEANGNIGTYQGGCGISVNDDCAAATNDHWYQSADFSVAADGKYIKITWDVPAEIQNDIDASGTVQIGYWWSDVMELDLKYVTCNYTRTTKIPVDETVEIPVAQQLNYQSDSAKTAKIPLSDYLDDGYTPQAITFEISSDKVFNKFNCGFGIQLKNDWYESPTVAKFSDQNHLSLTWIIPEDVKESIPKNAEAEFSYFWSESDLITLDSITMKYSYGKKGKLDKNRLPDDIDIQVMHQNEDAQKIIDNMTTIWSLGNTLDCYDVTWSVAEFETAWGNPKTSKKMIDTVKAAGFNTIRIPVSWTDHIDDEGNIDSIWLNRVQQVVDYAMDNHLYTILNMHHDDYTWLNPTYADEEAITQKYIKIWQQIADRFENYDTTLMFEGLNEPRVIDSPNEWKGGTPEEHEVINHLLEEFVETIRNSGGNNPMRTLIITTHAASIEKTAVEALEIPDDDNLIVSIHSYAPWQFTTYEYQDVTEFDDASKEELNAQFDYLKETFIDQGIPVIIGEFGAENKSNPEDRAEYYYYYITEAAKRGIPCGVWDNNVFDGEGSYGLLDRETCTWHSEEIITSIQQAIEEIK
ncbi:MAG: cellulase family glycosylhydrolase [Oscillospiraceae bacterium]|nr:cellulase family glycosylhydrolase [Oscillospiraceae bacterium]